MAVRRPAGPAPEMVTWGDVMSEGVMVVVVAFNCTANQLGTSHHLVIIFLS